MSTATDAVIVAGTRTPIGRSGRSLAGLSLHDIAMQTVSGVIATAGLEPGDIDDLILGECLQGETRRATSPTRWACHPTRRGAPCSASAPRG
jgi:acetyl-CoA C-acetyltransferase